MLRDAQTSKTHNYFAQTAVHYYRILRLRLHAIIYDLSFKASRGTRIFINASHDLFRN